MRPIQLQPQAAFLSALPADTEIIQSAFFELDTTPYENLVLWAEVISITLGGAASVEINYETQPYATGAAQDLWVPMIAPITLVVTPPITPSKILIAQNPLVPVGTKTRFRLTRTGVAVANWGATLEINGTAS